MQMPSDRVDITISAPGWIVTAGTLRERLNEPYLGALELASDRPEMEASSLLGTSLELGWRRAGIEQRALGIVTSVRERHEPGRSRATITLEPALAALRHRRDSRIFQQMSVPDILTAVLGAGLAPFRREIRQVLARTYPLREYCVQYQETDFDFAHRLMEEEGIVYFFAHDGDTEVMTLVDRNASHARLEGRTGSVVTFDEQARAIEPDRIRVFDPIARITGTQVATQHFDWTHPTTPIVATRGDGAPVSLESYVHDAPITLHQYAHAYGAHNASDQTELLRQLQGRDARIVEGEGSAIALRSGVIFDLDSHPRIELNAGYLVVEALHELGAAIEWRGDEDLRPDYRNRFQCIPLEVQWRPDRARARPRVSSIQTATVVGPAGEEIHTDEHGRVKAQFHWDRLGGRDDHSSCWIRVGQAMGGDGWGFTFVPRVGMECIVSFIEGDIDRPLITGVVYNTRNPPPVNLPADKTRTTIKSNSSPGGGGFNELRMEDKAGQEEIFLHGQKDWNTIINNDHTRSVGNNETQSVAVNRSRTVGANEDVSIGVDRTHVIGSNETQIVGTDRTRTVGANESISVGANRRKSIGGSETVKVSGKKTQRIGGGMKEAIGGALAQTIGKSLMQQIGKQFTQNVGLMHTVNVGGVSKKNVVGNDSTKAGMSWSVQSGTSATVKAGSTVTVKSKTEIKKEAPVVTTTAKDKWELAVGSAKITVESSGKIVIHGVDITLESGAGKINIDPGGIISIKGPMVKINT